MLFCLITFSISAQEKKAIEINSSISTTLRGMKLLDGYVHTRRQGIDSSVGRISKKGGVNISYDIGMPDEKLDVTINCLGYKLTSCVWKKEQELKGEPVQIVLLKNGQMQASFPKSGALFYAQIKSPEDIADFLLMILTY